MKQKSFTLIELLVVIAIIGLLASLIIVNLTGTRSKANIARGLQFSQSIHHVLGAYAVGVWSFDGGSGTTAFDASGYGNNGTLTNGPVWRCANIDPNYTPSGKGCSLQFDGVDDYVDAGQNINFGNSAFSVTFWAYGKVKTDWVPGVISRSVIGDFSAGCTSICKGWVVGLISGNNTSLSLRLSDGGATGSDGVTTVLTLNQWDHFVFTVSVGEGANKLNVYKNGILVGSTSRTSLSSGSIDDATASLLIGNWLNNNFNGLIDEVRIYEKALETAQVEELYYAGLDGLLVRGLINEQEYQGRLLSMGSRNP